MITTLFAGWDHTQMYGTLFKDVQGVFDGGP